MTEAQAPVFHAPVEFSVELEPITEHGETLSLKGLTTTTPTASGSTFDHKTTPDPDGGDSTVARVKATFASNTYIDVDPLPTGLEPCQQKNADAGKKKLDAHEKQHEAVFKRFDGSANLPGTVTIVRGKDEAFQAVAKPIVDAAATGAVEARMEPLRKDSAALDPAGGFVVDVDLDAGCPPPKEAATDTGGDDAGT